MNNFLICSKNHKHKHKLVVVQEATEEELVTIRETIAQAKKIQDFYFQHREKFTPPFTAAIKADADYKEWEKMKGEFRNKHQEYPNNILYKYRNAIIIPFENL